MATLTQLIDRIADRLSMVAGTGVQTYAEDRIAEMIQHKFDVLFEERFWPQFSNWATWTLDGTLGVPTADLTDIVKRFEDIGVIFPTNSNRALSKMKWLTLNPLTLSGSTPINYQAIPTVNPIKTQKVFHVWPKTSTGTLEAYYRTRPDTYTATDEVDFDDQALILGATFDYLEDDGTNPNATQKFRLLFEARVKQLERSLDSGPIDLDPASARPETFSFTALP